MTAPRTDYGQIVTDVQTGQLSVDQAALVVDPRIVDYSANFFGTDAPDLAPWENGRPQGPAARAFWANLATFRAIQQAASVLATARQAAASASRPARVAPPAPRFTCHRCGEHRDTTRRGHCDDCD